MRSTSTSLKMTCLRHAALVLSLAVIGTLSQQQQQSWQRPRRQFIGSEWVPLSHPCPTCRQFADSSDNRPNYDDIGLVPPRPPPAQRQVQGTSNFFPPPPPLQQNVFNQQRQRFPDFTFNQFPQQQTQFPQQQPQFPQQQSQFTQQQTQFPQQQPQFPQPPQFTQQPPFFTPQQQQSFLPQTYLNNPQFLLNENPQLFPLLNNQQLLQNQQKIQPPVNTGKDNQIRFRPEGQRLDLNKPPQNIQLEQDKAGPTNAPETHLQLPLNAAPTPFQVSPPGFSQQPFPQFQQSPPVHQAPFLSAPAQPVVNNSDIVIPGLDKEEIQLLYVPVETLRERGQLQGHTLEEARNPFATQFQQLQQGQPGHLITQPPGSTASQSPSPASVTPPPALTQNLPLRNQPENFSGSTATATPQGLSTTEQVVTIQPRPVSTVGHSDSSASTFSRTPSPQTTRHSNSPFSQRDILSNEVTPSYESATETTFQTTTLQPHQPPLAIYVTSNQGPGTVADILADFKSSDSVAVIDNYSPSNPKVFVGPGNLNAPDYNKYELPYLSNLEPSRIEQRDNLHFFVAPLNFNSPRGYSKIPFPAPHVGAVVYSDESEPEITTLPETTTTLRPRGRRPSQNKQSYRRPVSSSRQRVTPRPQEVEATSEYDSQVTSQRLRDPQERKRLSQSRRQRVRTTTEAVTEAVLASDLHHQTAETAQPLDDTSRPVSNSDLTQIPEQKLQEPVHPAADFQQVQPHSAQFQQSQYSQDEFVPPPPPSAFDTRRPQQIYEEQQTNFPSPVPTVQQHFETPKFEMFHPTPEEIQGIFGLSSPTPRPQEDGTTVRTNHGSRGEHSTVSSLHHFRGEDDEKLSESEEEGKQLESESIDFSKKKPHFSSGTAQLKSTTRNRASTTTTGPEYETESSIVTSTETPKSQSKYLSQFNRSRKPLRSTSAKPETTTSVPTTRGHTVRPLRRTTSRSTSVSTKRIRKPTTPLPYSDADTNEEASHDANLSPSGVSNEIGDERPVVAPKPKFRKPFYPKSKFSTEQTTANPSTRTYQERVDENHSNDYEVTAADAHVTHAPSQSSHAEGEGHESLSEEKKRVPDAEHKKARRRLRVKVKRPQDNFETAESQNHGAVSNLLVSPSHKPTAPDLYRFGKGEFDFEDSVKFIATQNKEHARNITADILESTDSFSSPGSDTTVQQVTIVSDHTTVMPESSAAALVSGEPAETASPSFEPTKPSSTEADFTTMMQQTTTPIPLTAVAKTEINDSTVLSAKEEVTEIPAEATTQADVVDETTIAVVDVTSPAVTTPPPSTTEAAKSQKQQRKVLRTSTTTQVSHETEICYKGKCIKTSSKNPELALKRLVEQANSEESTKVKT